jgi:hypothetical protein
VCVCVCVCVRARLHVYTMRVYISGVEGLCANGSTDNVRGKRVRVHAAGQGRTGFKEEEGLFKRSERG